MAQKQKENKPATQLDRRTVPVSAEIHKRLKVKAILTDKDISKLADELLDKALTAEGA